MARVSTTTLLAAVLTVSNAWAQPEPTEVPPDQEPAPPARRLRRVWRERNHGLRHGPGFKLIEVGGADGRLILLADDQGYIYRSTNGGATWVESRLSVSERVLFPIPLPRLGQVVLPNLDLFDGLPAVRADSVLRPAVRPGEDAEAGGEDEAAGSGGGSRGGALQPRDRAEDPGDLLSPLAHPIRADYVSWMTTCETNDTRAYAATDDGLYRTDDAGFTWYRTFVGANNYENQVLVVMCDDADADRVYIGTSGGFFWSRDAGVSWARPRSFSAGYKTWYMEQDESEPGRIIVGTTGGAYTTTNLEDFEVLYYPDIGSAESRVVYAIVSTPEHLYLGTGDGAVVSHDGGQTFEQLAPSLLNRAGIWIMQADPRDSAHVYILTSIGLWETRDAGRTVELVLLRSTIEDLHTFALDPNDPDRLLLLTGTQLLVSEPDRPEPPPRRADPVARAARRALATSPDAGEIVEHVLERMRLDNATVVGLRDAARHRNLMPQVSLVAGLSSVQGDRTLSGLGTIGLADGIYDGGNCRLAIRPPNCWIGATRFDLTTADRSAPFVWGVALLLRWNLSMATFDRAETNSIWRDVTKVRQRVMHTVADYWFERQRVLEELASTSHGPDETRDLTLRAAEMTSALDAMSGGMLTSPRRR